MVSKKSLTITTMWKPAGSNNGRLETEVTIGWSKEQVNRDEKTVYDEFNASIEGGYSFLGLSAKTTLSNKLATTIFTSS